VTPLTGRRLAVCDNSAMTNPDVPHTRATALDAVRRSTRSFLALFDGVSDRAWRLRPAGEEWSIAETVEHVVLSNRAILGRLAALPTAPLAADATRFDDAAISDAMFQGAGPAPALAPPKGRLATRAHGIAALCGAYEGIVAWSNGSRDDLRGFGLPHPLFGTFDGVQWLLFAAAHTDSHAAQLRSLRDIAGLPAS
jgi:DinB family protein